MMERISLKFGELFLALKREEGQGATEYAMVIGFLIILLVVAWGSLVTRSADFLGRVAGKVDRLSP